MEKSLAHPPQGTRIKFWGVRGSLPAPGPATVFYGGNTSCVEVRLGGEIVVLDAGTGIRSLGLALTAEFGETPINLTLLISHTHWDHIQGFPFFQPAYHPRNRVRILGFEGAKTNFAAVLAGQMESPYFPIPLRKMPGSIVIEELDVPEFSCGAFSIRAARMNHPGMTMGYRLATGDGTMVYIPDNEIARSAEGVHHPGLSIPGRTPGEIRKNLAGFIHGADVLIMDAQYEREEYAAHAGWGHGCVEDVVEIAVKSGVQRLFLFHHDPSRDDACVGRMVEQARDQAASLGSGLVINAAREGLEIVLQK